MDIRIQSSQYDKDYTYFVTFEDGACGTVDLEPFLFGRAFREIKRKGYFKKAFVHQETKTLTWPNGVDLAPEAIRKVLQTSDKT